MREAGGEEMRKLLETAFDEREKKMGFSFSITKYSVKFYIFFFSLSITLLFCQRKEKKNYLKK